jgi:hypothetical protein
MDGQRLHVAEVGRLQGQAHRTVGQLHARRAHLQVTLVLEEAQVPASLGHRVVHRMRALVAGHLKTAARPEVDQYRQQLGGFLAIHRRHRPRLHHSQCRLRSL